MTPCYDKDGISIYHGDCREVLPSLPVSDLVLTDPPYGIGVGDMQMQAGAKRSRFASFDWDSQPPEQSLIDGVVAAGYSAVLWGGNYFVLPPSRCWLMWDKVQEFSGSDFELAWTNIDKPCKAFRLSRVEAHTNGKAHPTQKPLSLMKWCLSFFPNAETVIDPFMGSGTTLVAAKHMGLRAVGIEREKKYCDAAISRLSQRVLAFAETTP